MALTPQILYGELLTNSGTAIANVTLIFTNIAGDTQTFTTNSSGRYLIDCNNFTNGVTDSELVSVSAVLDYTESDFDIFVSINSGNTWSQVANETTQTMRYNQGRIKIDTTNYPAGHMDLKVVTGS